jgi:flagellar capping protein FliD
MATSSTSSTSKSSGLSNLDSYYQNLVNYTLAQEKQPLTRLTTQKDQITVKKAAYTDLKTKFDAMLTAIKKLRSNDSTYALKSGRTVSITPNTTGTTVATATVGSSVSAGTYALSVTSLATAHEVRSTRQTYSDQGLGYSGTFVIGGAAVRSATVTTGPSSTVTSVVSDNSNTIASSHKEFGTGSYFIETRNSTSEGWQFRIVDNDGNAQSILEGSTTDFSSDWQSIPTGASYDTGRGMSVNFGAVPGDYTAANKATGAVKLDYVARGASIEVTSDMSLASISSNINSATYGTGNEVTSSIIDNTLILRSASTGTSHTILASNTTGTVLTDLGVISGSTLNTKVNPTDAHLSVNGMDMTRNSNTGLTDVISGMTLDLAPDAAGKSANLVVKNDMGAAQTTINSFLTAFNDLTKYIRGNTTSTKNADDTYTRGTLAGEYGIRSVGNELVAMMNRDFTNGGIYKNLSEIGISLNSDLVASISDTSLLSTTLVNNFSDVSKMIDSVMSSMLTKVETYTGTKGYINQAITSADTTVSSLTSRITSMNERLSRREESLVKYYADYQAQMETYMNQSKLNSSLYG